MKVGINIAKRAIEDFIENGHIRYAWLGGQTGDVDPEYFPGIAEDLRIEGSSGALVLNLFNDSPADTSGILPGDLIHMIDNTSIADSNDLSHIVGRKTPESVIELSIMRSGDERKVRVRLGERADESRIQENLSFWPGIAVGRLSEELRERLEIPPRTQGVVIVAVASDTSAGVSGLRQGDVITAIDGHAVENIMEFYEQLNAADNEPVLTVLRGEASFRVGIFK